MNYKTIRATIFALFVTALFGTSYAGISVSPAIIDLDPSASKSTTFAQDVRVINDGQQVAYVKITPKLVVNPGSKNEKQEEVKDPQALGLLVSPRKLMIEPGEFKIVRFVLTQKPGKVDRVFRVDIQPVTESLLLPKAKKEEEVGIKLLVGYAVLVMQRPENPEPKVSLKRVGRTITATNTGNTNVILVEGEQCNSDGDNCKNLETHRLYAGNTWTFTAPEATPVTFKGYFGDNRLNLKSN